jgi:hypothetical protein
MTFLEQRITVSAERPASRGLRRQLDRDKHPVFRNVPAVRVIELRRREHDNREHDESSGSDGPAWQYQWIVSGHWLELGHVPTSASPTAPNTVLVA